MKNLILIPCLLFAIFAQAQLSENTFMVISANTGVQFAQFSNRNTGSTGTTSAINIEVPVNRYFTVGAGFGLTNYGKQTNFTETLVRNAEDPNFGRYKIQNSSYELRYFSMPISAKMRYGKFHFFATAQPELARKGTELLVDEPVFNVSSTTDKSLPLDDVSKFNLTTLMGFGFSQSVNDNISFFIEPSIGYMVFQTYNNVDVDASQLMYGLKVGVQMQLTRPSL